MSVNKAILIGFLGADPETRNMKNGDPVVTMRIATSETWRDKASGERREKTEWHTVIIFNENIAKVATQYLRKGSRVYIEGQLQTRKWQDQAGTDRWSTEVILNNFNSKLDLLDRAERHAPSPDDYGTQKTTTTGAPSSYGTHPPAGSNYDDMGDNIPF